MKGKLTSIAWAITGTLLIGGAALGQSTVPNAKFVQSPKYLIVQPQEKAASNQDAPADPSPTKQEKDDGLKFKSISDIQVSPKVKGAKPENKFPEVLKLIENQPARQHSPKMAIFEAPNICYRPLYFEDVALERYGQTQGRLLQPWVSGARFLGQGFFLQYNGLVNGPWHCESPYGYARPGSCTPDQRQRFIFRR